MKSALILVIPLLFLASCTSWRSIPTVVRKDAFPCANKLSEAIKHPNWSKENPSYPSYAGISGPKAQSTPEDGAIEIVTYNFNHIWAGNGYASRQSKKCTDAKCSDGNYRAKLTVKGEGGRLIAEVFFIDEHCFKPEPGGIHCNPCTAETPPQGYFFLYFPAKALAGVQQTLAQPGTQKLLIFYDREWAVESMGDVSATH